MKHRPVIMRQCEIVLEVKAWCYELSNQNCEICMLVEKLEKEDKNMHKMDYGIFR